MSLLGLCRRIVLFESCALSSQLCSRYNFRVADNKNFISFKSQTRICFISMSQSYLKINKMHNDTQTMKHTHMQKELQEDPLVSNELSENQKDLLKSSNDFLEHFDPELQKILKKTFNRTISINYKARKKESAKKSKRLYSRYLPVSTINERYLFSNRGATQEIKTHRFEESKAFLESKGIPCDELQYYPNIQNMENARVELCLERLKEMGIQVIFSLFLIQRINEEILEENLPFLKDTLNPPEPREEEKPDKLMSDLKRLETLEETRVYFNLCKELDKSDLDPRWLVDELDKAKVKGKLEVILNRVHLLKSVGATADDILSNIRLLHISCQDKVKLYKATCKVIPGQFPIALWCLTLEKFAEKIGVHPEVYTVCKLLNVTPAILENTFQTRMQRIAKIYPEKFKMLLSLGISKKDLLNNFEEMNSISNEDLLKIASINQSFGLPISAYRLKELATISSHFETNLSINETDSETTFDKVDNEMESQSSTEERPDFYQKTTASSFKKKKKKIIKLINFYLNLPDEEQKRLKSLDMNLDDVTITDVKPNFEYLTKIGGFTIEDICSCPIVLIHPREKVIKVVKQLRWQIFSQLGIENVDEDKFRRMTTHSSDTDYITREYFDNNKSQHQLYNKIILERRIRIHVIQYLLEKDNNFSKGIMEDQFDAVIKM